MSSSSKMENKKNRRTTMIPESKIKTKAKQRRYSVLIVMQIQEAEGDLIQHLRVRGNKVWMMDMCQM